MKALLVCLCLVTFSSFVPIEKDIFKSADVQLRTMRPKRGAKKSWKQILQNQIETKNHRVLGYMVKSALKDGVSISKLQRYATELQCPELQSAIETAKRLERLEPKTGLTIADGVQLALYIDNEFEHEVKAYGNYRSRNSTGLPRTIEYDEISKLTFIHLKNHGGIEILGKGFKKVVTSSIMYDKKKPEVVAHCLTPTPMPEEIAAIKALQGLPGLFEVKAITERKAKDDTNYYSLICKLYPFGTLSKFLNTKSAKNGLSFKDRMRIGLDILIGLDNMHSHGYVHRDLGTRNFLIYRQNREKTRGKRYSAVIADFGRTIPIEEADARTAQATAFYRAPEALDHFALRASDYYFTDIYAVGCVFHSLFFKRPAPWVQMRYIKDDTKPVDERAEKMKKAIKRYTERRIKHFLRHNKNRTKPPIQERVERLILKMIDPEPEKRGTTKELLFLMRHLLNQTGNKR